MGKNATEKLRNMITNLSIDYADREFIPFDSLKRKIILEFGMDTRTVEKYMKMVSFLHLLRPHPSYSGFYSPFYIGIKSKELDDEKRMEEITKATMGIEQEKETENGKNTDRGQRPDFREG